MFETLYVVENNYKSKHLIYVDRPWRYIIQMYKKYPATENFVLARGEYCISSVPIPFYIQLLEAERPRFPFPTR
jgi:hypothetical protein